ncbi:MAG: hypothetical protein B6242_02255 [Anaerolineaceae bacterium 4572_78]|nr:MAG: hypothetical protein B6242_02255 [Anaerolineaceae bacterium 4572_78]
MQIKTLHLTDEEFVYIFHTKMEDVLIRRPELRPVVLHTFFKAFVSKEEFTTLWHEVGKLRSEMKEGFERVDQRFDEVNQRIDEVNQRVDTFEASVDQRFDEVNQRIDIFEASVDQRFDEVNQRIDIFEASVDQRFDALENKMNEGFERVERQITRIGSRWGIHTEKLLRQTIRALLVESFGVSVESRYIDGEQFDIVITNGEHILIEITASVRRDILSRLERKRSLYIESTGVTPSRVILGVGSIHHMLAQSLLKAGFEVIQPDYEEE